MNRRTLNDHRRELQTRVELKAVFLAGTASKQLVVISQIQIPIGRFERRNFRIHTQPAFRVSSSRVYSQTAHEPDNKKLARDMRTFKLTSILFDFEISFLVLSSY